MRRAEVVSCPVSRGSGPRISIFPQQGLPGVQMFCVPPASSRMASEINIEK